MSFNNPFGKKGVPKSAETLRVLGVFGKDDKGEQTQSEVDRGGDTIEFSKAESTRMKLREWVDTFSNDEYYNDQWFEEHFNIHADGSWEVIGQDLDLSHSDVSYLPEDLEVPLLDISGTRITEIPPSLKVQTIRVSSTNIETLPDHTGDLELFLFNGDDLHPLLNEVRARGFSFSLVR